MKHITVLISLLCFNLCLLAQIYLENTTINESVVVENLDIPWDMTYGSDGWIWYTEVSGKISKFNPDTDELQFVHQIPDVEVFGFSVGLHSIILHPNFSTSPFVYVHYSNSESTSKIVRFTYDPDLNTLNSGIDIITDIVAGASHNGSRMLIIEEKLYISIGDSYTNADSAQDLESKNGKILRMNLDGTVPTDNPISDSFIWSWGHRNPQGLCFGNNFIYSSEHGTFIDDEINIIEQNRNYGWPVVEGACDDPNEIDFCTEENVAEPIHAWTPSIAPSGMDFYNNDAIPEWENSLLLAVLKDREFLQLKLNEDGTEVTEVNSFLTQDYGRLRDVLVLPDGRIFICTSNNDWGGVPNPNDDVIIKLEPQLEDHVFNLTGNSSSLHLYPNPVSDGKLFLGMNDQISSPFYFEIINISGEVIGSDKGDFPNHIDTSALLPGMYSIVITTFEGQFSERFMVSE